MANEYVNAEELKEWLGIEGSDQDNTLELVAEAASRAVDSYCKRRFYLDDEPTPRVYAAEGRFVFVDDIGSTDGLVVKTADVPGSFDRTWTEGDHTGFGFLTQPLNALARGRPIERLESLANRWPCGEGRVQVTAKWGWPSVPADVKQATLLQAQALWTPSGILQSAGGEAGVVAVSLEGSDSVTYESSNVSLLAAKELVATAQSLLARYVRRRWVI